MYCIREDLQDECSLVTVDNKCPSDLWPNCELAIARAGATIGELGG